MNLRPPRIVPAIYAGFRPCQGHVQEDVGVMWFIFHAIQLLPTRLVLHWQIYTKTYAKIGLEIKPLLIWLGLSEVHVC